jgi:carbon monoxide dehydrogenase subunit G
MPEATIRFHSPAPASELRRLLSDPTFVASSIPQVIAVERTGDTTALWTVEVKLGPMVKKSVYRGELVEASDAGVRFRAQGPEATIEGTLSFAPADPSGTDVGLTLRMQGNGALRVVVDAYLAKRVKTDAEKFVQSLEERVGRPEAPPP